MDSHMGSRWRFYDRIAMLKNAKTSIVINTHGNAMLVLADFVEVSNDRNK